MHRLYSPSENISGDKIIIVDKNQIHHAKDVLRLKVNDTVIIFDGKGKEYAGIIQKLLPKELTVEVQEIRLNDQKLLLPEVTLAIAIPKRNRMDYLIEKCTELGVDTIIPMKTERTVVSIKKDNEPNRIARWEKIAIEASEQSGRTVLPKIKQIMEFSAVLPKAKDYDLAMLFCLIAEKRENLRQILSKFEAKRILAFIGPEGDFTPGEVNLSKEAGCVLVSLGQRILKVDTASIFIMAAVNLTQY
ncbi:MAG: RsmE family RNA methyltransferase [Candidatus Omnitrophota bacterium]|nr:RsmE family RNA methyltransferase [Candidatus Omnitrophota bacterium]